jgi:hypothetical protein
MDDFPRGTRYQSKPGYILDSPVCLGCHMHTPRAREEMPLQLVSKFYQNKSILQALFSHSHEAKL